MVSKIVTTLDMDARWLLTGKGSCSSKSVSVDNADGNVAIGSNNSVGNIAMNAGELDLLREQIELLKSQLADNEKNNRTIGGEKMNDDAAYLQTRRNIFSIFRVTCLFWPMSFGAICLTLSTLGVNPSESVRYILAFVYFLGLAAHSNAVRNYGTMSLFSDIKKRYNDQMVFFQTEELPEDPPLRDGGYVFARKQMEFENSLYAEYSEPYLVELKITHSTTYLDTFYISLSIDGNKLVNDERFSYESCSKIKSKALKHFEELGYNVVAIKNKYGDYMWIKGAHKSISQQQIIYVKLKMLLLQIIWFACQIAPLLWLLKPCVRVIDLD